jgi:hypothetical protein
MSFLRRLFGRQPEPAQERIIEPTGSNDFGPCSCCGDNSRSVWGFIHHGDTGEAAYFVHWTLRHVQLHGAHFDLALGRWGEDSSSNDRFAVSLEFRRTGQGPQFMVIDATDRPIAKGELVSRALRREEVIGTPLAQQVFDIVDAIWLQDQRIEEIRGAG